MTLPIDFRPDAELDLQYAHRWYEARQRGLGDAFVGRIDDNLYNISRFPNAYPAVHGEIRRCVLRRFPYSILYIVERARIVVLAIFHERRDPEDWKERE